MTGLPEPLQKLVDTILIQPRQPAFLLTDSQGRLLRWGGCVERYGLKGLQRGREIDAEGGGCRG